VALGASPEPIGEHRGEGFDRDYKSLLGSSSNGVRCRNSSFADLRWLADIMACRQLRRPSARPRKGMLTPSLGDSLLALRERADYRQMPLRP
jgi:hypothetical protein